MKFPFFDTEESQQFPQESRCLICSEAVGEVNGFVRLTAGGLDKDLSGLISRHFRSEYTALLSIWCHGPSQVQDSPDTGRSELEFEFAKCRYGKQVDFVFCSTVCLSKFFKEAISQLDIQLRNSGLDKLSIGIFDRIDGIGPD